MDWIFSLLSTLGIFAGALFILVFFHELGHFLAAKFFKMRVDKFSIGFPPKVAGFKKGETEYVIGATPLGGYVSIAGMIDESMDDDFLESEPKEWEFRSKPVWQRIIVIVAGVIFNVILAALIYTGVAWNYGQTVFPVDSMPGVYIAENSLASDIGFETGDRLVGVNGTRVEYFHQIFSPTALTSRNLSFMVKRNNDVLELAVPEGFLDRLNKESFIDLMNMMPSGISGVAGGSAASEAGIEAGDKIVAFNGREIAYWVQLTTAISENDGEAIITVERDGERIDLTANIENKVLGVVALTPSLVFEYEMLTHNLGTAAVVGVNETADTFTGIIQGLGQLFSGSISVRENLGGPVAIANFTKEATDVSGWLGFWQITAFLSVTLAIMNMLPIPALDGGHFMFLVYEGITRREPSAKVRMALQQVGFILLIGIFILVTFNDILRTFGG